MARGGVSGRPDSFLAKILEKFKREQEELLEKIKRTRSEKFFTPDSIPDPSQKGSYDRNNFLTFAATDQFMKKYNLQQHVGQVFVRTGNYQYSVPEIRPNNGHYSGLRKILERILPQRLMFNSKKIALENKERMLLSQQKSAPPKTSVGLRPRF